MEIGWIEYSSCIEGAPYSTTYNPLYSLNGLLHIAQYAVTIKILPSSDIPGSNETAEYTVMADICSNPIYALNNGYTMGLTVNETSDPPVVTGLVTGDDISENWIGDNAATVLWSGCYRLASVGDEPPKLETGSIYDACGNTGGLHITDEYCWFDWEDYTGNNISVYFGFDVNQERYCELSDGTYNLMTTTTTPSPTNTLTTTIPTASTTGWVLHNDSVILPREDRNMVVGYYNNSIHILYVLFVLVSPIQC